MTPWIADRDDPLVLVVGDSSPLPDEAVAPEPAPDEDPPVLDATAATVPVCEDWM